MYDYRVQSPHGDRCNCWGRASRRIERRHREARQIGKPMPDKATPKRGLPEGAFVRVTDETHDFYNRVGEVGAFDGATGSYNVRFHMGQWYDGEEGWFSSLIHGSKLEEVRGE